MIYQPKLYRKTTLPTHFMNTPAVVTTPTVTSTKIALVQRVIITSPSLLSPQQPKTAKGQHPNNCPRHLDSHEPQPSLHAVEEKTLHSLISRAWILKHVGRSVQGPQGRSLCPERSGSRLYDHAGQDRICDNLLNKTS